jgi:renalase
VTARSKEIKNYLEDVAGLGYAARWNPRAQLNGEEGAAGQMLPWYAGTPRMASLVRPLAESVRIHTGRKVHAVAVTVPAAQARLLPAGSTKFRNP